MQVQTRSVSENIGEKWLRIQSDGGGSCLGLNTSLDEIVPRLLKRFSSREGYRAFQDALPTSKTSNSAT